MQFLCQYPHEEKCKIALGPCADAERKQLQAGAKKLFICKLFAINSIRFPPNTYTCAPRNPNWSRERRIFFIIAIRHSQWFRINSIQNIVYCRFCQHSIQGFDMLPNKRTRKNWQFLGMHACIGNGEFHSTRRKCAIVWINIVFFLGGLTMVPRRCIYRHRLKACKVNTKLSLTYLQILVIIMQWLLPLQLTRNPTNFHTNDKYRFIFPETWFNLKHSRRRMSSAYHQLKLSKLTHSQQKNICPSFLLQKCHVSFFFSTLFRRISPIRSRATSKSKMEPTPIGYPLIVHRCVPLFIRMTRDSSIATQPCQLLRREKKLSGFITYSKWILLAVFLACGFGLGLNVKRPHYTSDIQILIWFRPVFVSSLFALHFFPLSPLHSHRSRNRGPAHVTTIHAPCQTLHWISLKRTRWWTKAFPHFSDNRF